MAWLGRILRRLTGFCLGGSALLLLVFGLLFVRLIAGPIEVPLREQLLDRAVAGLAPGWKVEASGADLDLFDRDGLSGLRLRDVTVLDAGGEEVARAPLLALKLAWDSSGTDSIALREVAVSGMTVLVTRRADGGFHLGLGDAEGGAIGVSQLLAGKPEGNTASAVPRLRIRDAKLRYRDIARDLDLTAENATLVLDPRSEGLHLTLDAGFRRADLEPMFVQVDVLESAVDKGFSGNVSFDGLMPAELAPLDPVLAPLDAVRATLSGAFRFALNAEGVPATVSGSFSGAPGGEIVLAGEPRRFTRLATGVEYDAASGELLLERLELAAEDVEIAGNARVEIGEDGPRAAFLDLPTLAYAPEGAARRLNVHDIRANLALEGGGDTVILRSLQASDLALTDEGGTATLASLEAEGDYLREERRLRVTALAGRDLAVTAAGEAGSGGASRLGGNAVVDLEQGLVRFSDLLLSEIRARTPDANVSAVSMGVGGIYDFGSGVLGLAGGEISGLAASAQNGTGFDARSVALGGRVEMRGGTFETEELVVTDLSVSLPDRFDAPLRASSIGARLSGRGEAEGYRLRAGELRALIDGLPAILKADILLRKDGSASGRLDTELGPVSAAEVPGFWPKRVAPGALRWVRKNVRSGAIPAVTIEAIFDTADPASDAMNLDFSFHDAVVGIAGDLPPIVAARGVARATLHEFNLSLETGQVEVPGNGHFTLQNSTFAIRDFKPRIPVGHLDLDIDGPVRPILAFLDTQPLGFISKSGFDISTASARARGRVQVSLPLALDMRLEDVEYGARAELHDFRFDEPHTALPISGDVLRITVQEEGLEFAGDARIDGLSARLSYSQRFAAPKEGEPESRLTVSSFLTPEDFARRGVDVTGYLDGVAAIDATADLYPGGGGRIRVQADLTGAALDIATLGWSKPDGVPVTISAEGFRNPDGAGKVERFVVAGAASAEGSVVYDGSGAVGADVRQLRLGEKFDGAVRYNRAANGNSRVELEGTLADLRTAFARAVDSSSGSRPAPQRRDGPVTEIAVKLDRALLRDDLALQRVSGGLRLKGESIAAAKVVGHANGVAPFELLAERRTDGLALRVSSEDAGAFLGAASVFSGAYGGTLRVDARTRDSVLPAEVAGTVLINDIEVRDSATMRSILSGGAIGSLVHQMTSGGLRFNKVSLPFAGVGGRWQIDNGVAYGPALGLTLTGGYDIARKGIDLRGTVSPAYAINGALGSVPLLGALLTGGEGEGVFGVTFSVGGTTDSPNVWVNPLSAIAPGFLRKIVSGVMDGQQATPETRRRLEERLRARTPD